MHKNDFAFIAGDGGGYDFPLQNFLPSLPKQIFSAWVQENQLEKNYLIDPISANPILPIELASKGCRVLASRSNPINWLITEILCREDCAREISSSVNKLLISRKDGRSMEDLLKPIYLTPCSGCGNMIQAEGFVWEKGRPFPISRVYTCPQCGDAGEKETVIEDLENLKQLGNLDIYQARAIQRVNPEKEYEKESVNAALKCYLPRALYVCTLLINRFDLLEADKEAKNNLRAALLTVFNDAHSLRHWPVREYRFLQFSVPQIFFEKNLFLSLTQAHKKWPSQGSSIPISYWPKLPPVNGGICFFQSRLAEQKELFSGLEKVCVVAVFPRPGQAYWTFSAIWSGWLWGKNAVKPLRSAIRRRQYDWLWYAKAIHQSVKRLKLRTDSQIRIFGILPEYTPNLSFGLFTGMQSAGFELTGAAFREKERGLQAAWTLGGKARDIPSKKLNIKEVIQSSLNGLSEPREFQEILMLVILQMALQGQVAHDIEDLEEQDYSTLYEHIRKELQAPGSTVPVDIENQTARNFLLYDRETASSPFSEQVEEFVVGILRDANEISLRTIDRMACEQFKEVQAPKIELITTILDSYAVKVREDSQIYKIREGERRTDRERDASEISEIILNLGRKIGFSVANENKISWIDKASQKTAYDFSIKLSANLADPMFLLDAEEGVQHVLLYPGSRALLVHYRMQEDARIREAVENGWHLVKFRHIRRLAEKETMTDVLWRDLIDRDPPLKEPPVQLQII